VKKGGFDPHGAYGGARKKSAEDREGKDEGKSYCLKEKGSARSEEELGSEKGMREREGLLLWLNIFTRQEKIRAH